jgi:hypothetical protein
MYPVPDEHVHECLSRVFLISNTLQDDISAISHIGEQFFDGVIAVVSDLTLFNDSCTFHFEVENTRNEWVEMGSTSISHQMNENE